MAFSTDFPDSEIPEGITRKQIINYGRLRGSKMSLDKEHGLDNWGVPEILKRLQAKIQVVQVAKDTRSKDEQKRYEEYTKSFENITPNDEHNLRMLVALEDRMKSIQQDLKSPREGQRIKELSDSFSKLSSEHRQLETILGIGRNTRGDQINIASELENFKKDASELIQKSSTKISCSNCKSQFNFGFIVFHFRDDVPWNFSFRCPKCKELSIITGSKDFGEIPFDIPDLELEILGEQI